MITMATMTKMSKTDEIKASQILVDNTFVAGDKTRLRYPPQGYTFLSLLISITCKIQPNMAIKNTHLKTNTNISTKIPIAL